MITKEESEEDEVRERSAVLAGLTAAIVGTFIVGSASPALAHEERTVGRYHFAVGFGDEPAYTGQKNSVQLLLAGPNDKPVVDLTDTLKVEVIFGNQKLELPLEPDFEVGEFGIPGDYRAWFFPTRAGGYTFHFFGAIKGQKVDERFTSSPTTFSEVTDPSQVEFPAKDPTAAQVAQRLDREVPRLRTALADQGRRAKKDADSARTIGFVGLGVGILALVVAAASLITGRRRTGSGTRAEGARASTPAGT
jgi:hypothetical protein